MRPYLKIIRLPNLGIIVITQYLLRYCVIGNWYAYSGVNAAFSNLDFALLVFSTILITAGGNIINDVFDVETDKINKPEKMLIGKSVSGLSAKILYLVFSVSGLLIGVYLAVQVKSLQLGLIFLAIVIMLFLYSKTYQKTLLLGNVIVASLSAMVILIVWLFEFFALTSNPVVYVKVQSSLKLVSYIFFAYAIFAFIVSMIREILKDAEDIEGDGESGYGTLAIVYGNNAAKYLASSIIVLGIALLAFSQYWLFKNDFLLVTWYLGIVQVLFLYVLYYVIKAKTKKDFHSVSNAVKIIMVAGILSMQLFCVSQP
ncbi:MAG: UbiA family prenyltransferase [Chlorobi bacterium]|nr:UbiA family prenyltransferase [Chlorobiota bacterium]